MEGDDASTRMADDQRAVCSELANRHGLRVVGEYVDHGPAVASRQGELQRLIDDVTSQAVCAVLVYDLARLAGDLVRLETILAELKARGADVLTVMGVEVAERFVAAQRMREAFRRLPQVGGAE
ncbi:hypothetical protein BJP25_05630 [Actinokineospora bangkokensis]|uniref:Resolvase/invertase-type recombinase catalytic domain-containing protein n=1 Tax=Actinokineospora bangkokensis TaxID=1193682 RepID=A0A1Q9LBZ8_9PSEU|nr:hypothetical protein BJP25_05630 [Actinokineospora bangkokensis]